jgi:acyl-CoA dehydrogenase
MDFKISDEQKKLVEMCRDFAMNEIRPLSRELDKKTDPNDCWSWDLIKKASKLGLRTSGIPKELGGGGIDLSTAVLMWEELAVADSVIAWVLTGDRVVLDIPALSEELKSYLFPKFVEDDTFLLGVAASEHRGATENFLRYQPGGVDTYAEKKGDEYIINGKKAYCTGGPRTKAISVHVRTDKKAPYDQSVVQFMIPTDTPGFTFGKTIDGLGIRCVPTSELILEDVRVPASFMINPTPTGGPRTFSQLGSLKGACMIGLCRALYEEARDFARVRVVCGKPIIQHDNIKVMLADMKMKIDSARAMMWKTAWQIDHHPEMVMENFQDAILLKGLMQTNIPSIIKNADEIHGAFGTNKEWVVEKLIRDAFTWLHGGGCTSIMLMMGAPR